MEPPAKIYLQVDPEGEKAMEFDGVTWCPDKINDSDVEYIRADLVNKDKLLCLYLLKKREFDGLNGRTWNATEHLEWENRVECFLRQHNEHPKLP